MQPCSKETDIDRIIKIIDGNGREGLCTKVTVLNTKMDGVVTSVAKVKALLQWLIGTVILGVIAIAVSILVSL